jgi:single-strand DNA-binding protein
MSGFTLNTVTVSGNLTRDPELRSTSGGTSVCSLRIAVNERRKNQATNDWEDRPNYFNVTIWSGLGEWVANNLGKGAGIAVSGRLSWHEWDTQDGQHREAVDIIADSIMPQRDHTGGTGGPSAGRVREPESDVPIDTGDLPPVPVGTAATPVDDTDDIPF